MHLFLRFLMLIFISTAPQCAFGSIIRNLQRQILRVSASNQRLEGSVVDLRNHVDVLEAESSSVGKKMGIFVDKISVLERKFEDLNKNLADKNEQERYFYDVIDRQHLQGLRDFALANPDLPVLLHLQKGKIIRLENFGAPKRFQDRLDSLEKKLEMEISNRKAFEHRFNDLKRSTGDLRGKLDEIHDFSGTSELLEVGSGEDAPFLQVSGSSAFLPTEELFGKKLQKLDDFCRGQIKSIQKTLKTTAHKSDFVLLASDLKNISGNVRALQKGSRKSEIETERLAQTIKLTSIHMKNSTKTLANRISSQTGLVKKVKSMQASYFTELQNFGIRLNLQETDLLKYKVKLGQLQTDLLNFSLTVHREEKSDLTRDLKILDLEKTSGNMKRSVKDIQDVQLKLRDSMTSYALASEVSDLAMKLENYDSYLRTHRSYFIKLTQKVSALTGSVERLESTVPEFCEVSDKAVQLIKPENAKQSFQVLCTNISASEDPWLVIQQRKNDLQSFNQSFSDYEVGFGNFTDGNFWLGNQYLHYLTETPMCLKIFMLDIFGDHYTATYTSFQIGDSRSGYKLQISGFSGNASDSLSYHAGMKFSTFDQDQDASSTHCARFYNSGWWFAHCQRANLNGAYPIGLVWFHETKQTYLQLSQTKMVIRKRC